MGGRCGYGWAVFWSEEVVGMWAGVGPWLVCWDNRWKVEIVDLERGIGVVVSAKW